MSILIPDCPPPTLLQTDAFIQNLLQFPTETIPQPQRYERKGTKGYHLPKGVVCVGRPTRWCNPFDTAEEFRLAAYIILEGGGLDVVACRPAIYYHVKRIIQDIDQLRGKSLACWCSLNSDCHADTLIELAND